jgi:hypothetical protein
MYVKVMVEARRRGCTHMVFDILEGGVDRVIKATLVFRVMCIFQLHRVVFSIRKKSYQTQTEDQRKEQFEQIYLDLRIMVVAIHMFRKIISVISWFNPKAKVYASYFDFLDGNAVSKTNSEGTKNSISWWIAGIVVGVTIGTASFAAKKMFFTQR